MNWLVDVGRGLEEVTGGRRGLHYMTWASYRSRLGRLRGWVFRVFRLGAARGAEGWVSRASRAGVIRNE